VSYKLASKLKRAGFPQREGWYISKDNVIYWELGPCPNPFLPTIEQLEEEIRKYPEDLVRSWEDWMELRSDDLRLTREYFAIAWFRIRREWKKQQASTSSN